MNELRPKKRVARGAPGVKALITATSVAVTLGGWALLTRAQPPLADVAPEPSPITIVTAQPAPDVGLELGPIPALVMPPPPKPPKIVIDRPPAIPADLPAARRPAVAHPAAAVALAVPAPAPDAPAPAPQPVVVQPAAPPPPLPVVNQPPLRTVSAPPKPAARTRSSR